ncbi:MAG TPA: M24 family metallopeptidase [Gemmatimonadaceae bacterium]|nr:M24 family metallopeptidase [Gemmatimonadaceae bacterium]
MLTPDTLPRVQAALAEAGLDGWLLFDFRGINPIATGLLGLQGMVTRRVFAYVPRAGVPTALTHAIEQTQWERWPAAWRRERYSAWRELEERLGELVGGKRVAMEYSPGDAVPYVDRIPAGVLEMVCGAGAEVVSSGELVSRFYAVWTPEQLAAHRRAAEAVAAIAADAFDSVGAHLRDGTPVFEHEVAQRIRDAFARAGLVTDHGPNVSAGANAANPHYEPSAAHPRRIERGELLLIDLWAGEPGAPQADQTWMASVGEPSARAREVWTAVRDARDAAIALLRRRAGGEPPIRGAEVDDAARAVIEARGLGAYFTHRTGHSIDARDLHGSGPHLDNLETREERLLIPGVGFSIEPGVYIPGEIGVRSEVNAVMTVDGVLITPEHYQQELRVL